MAKFLKDMSNVQTSDFNQMDCEWDTELRKQPGLPEHFLKLLSDFSDACFVLNGRGEERAAADRAYENQLGCCAVSWDRLVTSWHELNVEMPGHGFDGILTNCEFHKKIGIGPFAEQKSDNEFLPKHLPDDSSKNIKRKVISNDDQDTNVEHRDQNGDIGDSNSKDIDDTNAENILSKKVSAKQSKESKRKKKKSEENTTETAMPKAAGDTLSQTGSTPTLLRTPSPPSKSFPRSTSPQTPSSIVKFDRDRTISDCMAKGMSKQDAERAAMWKAKEIQEKNQAAKKIIKMANTHGVDSPEKSGTVEKEIEQYMQRKAERDAKKKKKKMDKAIKNNAELAHAQIPSIASTNDAHHQKDTNPRSQPKSESLQKQSQKQSLTAEQSSATPGAPATILTDVQAVLSKARKSAAAALTRNSNHYKNQPVVRLPKLNQRIAKKAAWKSELNFKRGHAGTADRHVRF